MSIIDTVLNMTDLDEKLTAKMTELGVSMDELKTLKSKYDELNADGTITKDEVIAHVKSFAAEKGISTDIFDKVIGMLNTGSDAASDATTAAVETVSDVVDSANDAIAK